jgi:hypothetical protein
MGGVRSSRYDGAEDDIEESLWKLDCCLSKLNPDSLGWDDTERYLAWIRVGIICHHATDGDERGLALWDEWSKRGQRYEQGACDDKWDTFATDRQERAGIGTLVNMVRESTGDQTWKIPKKPIFVTVGLPANLISSWKSL